MPSRIRGLTREVGIALLDRAAEVGLLTSLGSGCYTIHPAVPWFFKSIFDAYFASSPIGASSDGVRVYSPAERSMQAFVTAVGFLGVTITMTTSTAIVV